MESFEGAFPDPSLKAFRILRADEGNNQTESRQHLYRVRFLHQHVWPEGRVDADDTVTVELYESFLQAVTEAEVERTWEVDPSRIIMHTDHHHHHHYDQHNHRRLNHSPDHELSNFNLDNNPDHDHNPNPDDNHGHGHDHGHDHDHVHECRDDIEQRAVDLESSSDQGMSRLTAALVSLLASPAHLGPALISDIRHVIDANESARVRADGARLVARAWTCPEFKNRLLTDAPAAAAEV